MSKRTDRREAERAARKLAYQLRQGATASQSSKIISEAQLAANQANARLSHGPATPEGIASPPKEFLRSVLISGSCILDGIAFAPAKAEVRTDSFRHVLRASCIAALSYKN